MADDPEEPKTAPVEPTGSPAPHIIINDVESFNNGGAGIQVAGDVKARLSNLKTYDNKKGGVVIGPPGRSTS